MALTKLKLQVGGSVIDIDVDETPSGRSKSAYREPDSGVSGTTPGKGYIDVEIL